MEDKNRLNQEGKFTLAVEPLRALENMVDTLDAKVDSLDKRLEKAEAQLEEVVADQGYREGRS